MATAKTTNGRSTPDSADIAAQLETVKADLAALSQTMADYGRGKGAEARAHVNERANDLSDAARLKGEQARAEIDRMTAQTGDMVRSNPGAALGVAAGVGFLVGFLSSRR